MTFLYCGQILKNSIDTQTKVELYSPQLTLAKVAQLGRHETVKTRSEHYSPRVAGSIPVRGNFLLNFFCSNIILAELPEKFILRKTRMPVMTDQRNKNVVFLLVFCFSMVEPAGNSLVSCAACQAVQVRDWTCDVNCHVTKGNNGKSIGTSIGRSNRISFIFYAVFWEKKGQIIGWRPSRSGKSWIHHCNP